MNDIVHEGRFFDRTAVNNTTYTVTHIWAVIAIKYVVVYFKVFYWIIIIMEIATATFIVKHGNPDHLSSWTCGIKDIVPEYYLLWFSDPEAAPNSV